MYDKTALKKYKAISNAFLALLILLSALPYTPLPNLFTLEVFQNYLMPIAWGIICFLFWRVIPRLHPLAKLRIRESLPMDVILCATALVGFRLLSGFLIDQFGNNPYDSSAIGILRNIVRVGPELIAKELIRSYFLCSYCRKGHNPLFWLISITLALCNIPWNNALEVNGMETLLHFFAKTLGPELSISILLSTFALYGGPKATILYAGIMKGFLLFFPILPNLQWFTEGVINIALPVIETFYIAEKYEHTQKQRWGQKESIFNIVSWTLTLSLSVLLIWFVVGVFPLYPSVIATGSMRPLIYEGDVIIIKKAMKEEDIFNLKQGDIIQFTRDDILITHRINKVFKDEKGNLSFQTKGDNNGSIDTQIVLPNEVRGTLVKVIPKIGLPTLFIKTRRQKQPEGVEN